MVSDKFSPGFPSFAGWIGGGSLFRRYRLASLLHLLGLSVALAAFYLFQTQVHYNQTYNHSLLEWQRTFRVEQTGGDGEWHTHLCRPLEKVFRKVPHVEALQATFCYANRAIVQVGDKSFNEPFFAIDRQGLDFLWGQTLSGTCNWEETPGGVLISQSQAQKLFGTDDAAGRTIRLLDFQQEEQQVVGVYRDLPENCSLSNCIFCCLGKGDEDSWQEWSYTQYIRLDDPANRAEAERGMMRALADLYEIPDTADLDEELRLKFRLTPLADTYFSGVNEDDRGNRNMVSVLRWASVFVLLVALLNFINFTLALAPMRIRSVNTRRVLGDSVWHLRLEQVGANVCLSLVAFALALLLVVLFLHVPGTADLVSGRVELEAHPWLVAVTLVLALVLGILSALYPAWYATSFPPALVLKGNFGLSPQGRRLRTVLVAVQFGIALVLTAYVGVMYLQRRYIYSADYGFQKDEVFFASGIGSSREAIRTELEKLPGFESVSFGQNVPGSVDQFMQWGRNNGDRHINLDVLVVDWKFLRTMGIEVAEGRDFTEADTQTGAFVVNRALIDQNEWLHPGEPLCDDGQLVVGVCDRIQFTSLRKDASQRPMAFAILGPKYADWSDRLNYMFVRIAAGTDKLEARCQAHEVLSQFPGGEEVDFRFLDDCLQMTYESEFRYIRQVQLFAAVCIFITLIGVFCLTMFETEYRRREIGIRRILGSTVPQILGLLTQRYAWMLLLMFLPAIPLAWWLSRLWLQSFALHTPIRWWLFPLSLLLVGLVVLLTVVVQSWRTATQNPAESVSRE